MPRRKQSAIVTHETHAEVELTKGFWAKIDIEDIPLVQERAWSATSARAGQFYAAYRSPHPPKRLVMMHWVILSFQGGRHTGFEVDHINHDRLDNRRCNLRICTQAQNRVNSPISLDRMIRGVSKNGPYWRAQIGHMYLGTFPDIVDAAAAYNVSALLFYGEHAVLNDLTLIEANREQIEARLRGLA